VTAALPPEVIEAARREKEVALTTVGRKTGRPRRVTIWITTDGEHLFVRSGGGLTRDWPQNLLARGEATLHLGGRSIKVKPRHVTGPAEARAVSGLVRKKYGMFVRASKPNQALTPGEQATFELTPVV
jgi:deazaflavin-dependent oxidoreductase (nitroreductase family)